MNLPAEVSTTHRALHAVAELLIAGPQHRLLPSQRENIDASSASGV